MFFDVSKLEEKKSPAPAQRCARLLFDQKTIPGAPMSMASFRFAPGQSGPPHLHETEVEVYYCLEGEGIVTLDGVEHTLTPHTALYIPPTKMHETRNSGTVDFAFLAIFGPAVSLEFIREWEKA